MRFVAIAIVLSAALACSSSNAEDTTPEPRATPTPTASSTSDDAPAVKAYVWNVLEEEVGSRRGLVQDEVSGVPLAVVFDLDARYVHALDRRTDGTVRQLSFEAGGGIDRHRIVDDQGNRWRIDGRAVDAERDLQSLPGHRAFWFAWSAFHPGTPIYGRDEPIREAEIESDGECLVPCDEIVRGCGGGLDCIPPLDDPKMVGPDSPEIDYLRDDSLVLGVMTPDGPRAYPLNVLFWHEIANEKVGDFAYAITFCPLTGTGLLFDRTAFVEGKTVRVGVSGNLYNANLVMWDSDEPNPREEEEFSLWPQMRMQAVAGPAKGERTPLLPVREMTWAAWRELHPDTRVLSGNTGHSRDYTEYPYGDYRTNDDDTFREINPPPDPKFDNKDRVFGLVLSE